MLRKGRGIDNDFAAHHGLYYRCTQEDMDGDKLDPFRIRAHNTSVNWSKYSKPWDVIFDHPGHGIAEFLVSDLPRALPQELPIAKGTKLRDFLPCHDPLCINYSHSEVGTFTDGNRIPKPSLSKKVVKEFQIHMAQRATILRVPKI